MLIRATWYKKEREEKRNRFCRRENIERKKNRASYSTTSGRIFAPYGRVERLADAEADGKADANDKDNDEDLDGNPGAAGEARHVCAAALTLGRLGALFPVVFARPDLSVVLPVQHDAGSGMFVRRAIGHHGLDIRVEWVLAPVGTGRSVAAGAGRPVKGTRVGRYRRRGQGCLFERGNRRLDLNASRGRLMICDVGRGRHDVDGRRETRGTERVVDDRGGGARVRPVYQVGNAVGASVKGGA